MNFGCRLFAPAACVLPLVLALVGCGGGSNPNSGNQNPQNLPLAVTISGSGTGTVSSTPVRHQLRKDLYLRLPDRHVSQACGNSCGGVDFRRMGRSLFRGRSMFCHDGCQQQRLRHGGLQCHANVFARRFSGRKRVRGGRQHASGDQLRIGLQCQFQFRHRCSVIGDPICGFCLRRLVGSMFRGYNVQHNSGRG